MRVITLNANGIRSAAQKGFFDWLTTQNADVVCLQETRAQSTQLQHVQFHPSNYHCYHYDAQRKGYSGVALYARREPDEVIYGFGWPSIDAEARYYDYALSQTLLESGTVDP